jgi:DNA-binding LacI/PurR family transcriptional regulator/DNA-binding transcriptional regulator YhcF (GntR family)
VLNLLNIGGTMKNKEPGPAVQKAFDFVKDNLAEGTWQMGERLPATRNLSAQAGVSNFTMIKAVSLLKSQGLVSGFERGNLRAGDGKGTHQQQNVENELWEIKRTALEQDILTGKYAKQGKMPSFKELQIRYGACYRTMRKILRAMLADGVLRLRGKTLELQRSLGQHYSPRVVFITYHHIRLLPRSALNQGQYRVLDLLEQECNQREIAMEIVEIASYSSQEIRRAASDASKAEPVLGFILDLWWYPNEEFQRSHIDLLTRLAALKKPIAILDEVGTFSLPMQFTSNPLIQVFRIEGKKAGSRVARLLLGLGHRSVAYISLNHGGLWSKQRHDGIVEQYQKAGLSQGVRTVMKKTNGISRESALALSDLSEKVIRRILAAGQQTDDTNELYRAYLQYKKSFSPDQFTRDEIRVINDELIILNDLVNRNAGKELFDRICFEVFNDIAKQFIAKPRFELFEQALTFPDITAWICESDGLALMALSFLRDRNIPVPRELSVVGFDNQPVDALESRLTTVDFNASGFINRMLNFILRPPRPRGQYQHQAIEVESIIMQRETVAKPET